MSQSATAQLDNKLAERLGGQLHAVGTVNAAFTQLTRLLAAELAPRVRVNGVTSSVVDTDGLRMVLTDELRRRIVSATPLRRLGAVADVATTATWLASPAASYITGKVIEIDGGAEAATFPNDAPDLRPEDMPVRGSRF